MKITSRSALSFPASAIGISVIASSPGPPASQRIGSSLACGAAAGTIATERLSVLLLAPRRSSGTRSCPHRARLSSGIGCGIAGHGPATNDGSAAAGTATTAPALDAIRAQDAPTIQAIGFTSLRPPYRRPIDRLAKGLQRRQTYAYKASLRTVEIDIRS